MIKFGHVDCYCKIDIDDIYGTDPYGRWVGVVYVRYNSTHCLNVNYALYLILLITISLMSAFIANTPTTLIFIPIIEALINAGFSPVVLFIIFIFGIHLGGNLVPQGAVAHITTLNIAERSGVSNLNYKRLLKIGFPLTIIQLLIILGFVYILVLLT